MEMRSSTSSRRVKLEEEELIDEEEADDRFKRERVLGPTAPTLGRLFLAWYVLTASLVRFP